MRTPRPHAREGVPGGPVPAPTATRVAGPPRRPGLSGPRARPPVSGARWLCLFPASAECGPRGGGNPGRLVRGVYLKRGCRRLSRGLRFAGGPGARHVPPGLSRPPRFGPSAVTVAEASFPSPRPPTRTHCGQVALILRSLHLRGLPMGP